MNSFRTVQTVAAWIAKQAQKIHDWAVNIYKKISAAAGDVWRSVTSIGGWLGKQGSAIAQWASGIPAKIGKALAGMWSLLPNLSTFLGKQLCGLGPIGTAAANLLGLPGGGGGGGSKGTRASGGADGAASKGGGLAGARWASTISQALKMAHAPQSWLGDIETIIAKESGGNPKAINLTDSNAKAGHPSQGLMQTIPSTFSAYAGSLAKRGITDPLANNYAGIRYIQSRYGSVGNVPGIKALNNGGSYVGYAAGGAVKGTANSDLIHAMLKSGEYILKREAVARIGVNNLNNINLGAMDPRQAWMTTLQNNMMMTMPGVMRHVAAPKSSGPQTVTWNIVQNFPKPESSQAVARTVRSLSYPQGALMATNKIPWQSTLHEARVSEGLVYWRPIGHPFWQVVSASDSAKLLAVYTFNE